MFLAHLVKLDNTMCAYNKDANNVWVFSTKLAIEDDPVVLC
jgi:hypothetical protein